MDRPARSSGGRHPVHLYPFQYLIVVPVLLAVATAVLLFFQSDVNVALLYSQCSARARLPFLSHLPVVGPPACFLTSFFQEALGSVRSAAAMAAILSGVAGLLTVSTVEAARIVNGPAVLIAYPTGAWLVFNLVGGALVWELAIVPAFLHRARQVLAADEGPKPSATNDNDAAQPAPAPPAVAARPDVGASRRHLSAAVEAVAIPAAVALGYAVPSVAMLVSDSPAAIVVWLFFPLYVSVVRQAVRYGLTRFAAEHPSLHLESHRPSLLAVYALPVACSALSHGFFFWSLFQPDDRREMTLATIKLIEIDFFFIALTVVYWVFVEAGWRVALIVVGVSVLLGPGAGVCIGWVYRESHFDRLALDVEEAAVDDNGQSAEPSEETPLLH